VRVGIWAGVFAVVVEVGKMVRVGWLDAFRVTFVGKVLLGRYFSGWDILAYGVGIAVVAGVDWRVGIGKRA
jgi:beta-N-acetylhexosaminidase